MRCRFKTTLFWLLLLALPTQGLASATMLFCEAAPRAGTVMSGDHHHVAGDPAAGPEDSTAAHHHAQNNCHDSTHGSPCAGCVAYCAGTFIIPSLFALSPLVMSDVQPASFALVSVPSPGFDGPYRPPRNIFA
jgi:hypothetical protein